MLLFRERVHHIPPNGFAAGKSSTQKVPDGRGRADVEGGHTAPCWLPKQKEGRLKMVAISTKNSRKLYSL